MVVTIVGQFPMPTRLTQTEMESAMLVIIVSTLLILTRPTQIRTGSEMLVTFQGQIMWMSKLLF